MNPQPAQPGLTETLAPERGAGRNVRATWLAWSLCLVCVVLALTSLILATLNGRTLDYIFDVATIATVAVAFSGVGALIASRRPGNPIGWIFCFAALFQGLIIFGEEYATYALLTRPGSLPLGPEASWLKEWIWAPGLGLILVFLPLLFPDGRPPSRRWWWVAWLGGLSIGLISVLGSVLFWPDRGPVLMRHGGGAEYVVAPVWALVTDFVAFPMMLIAGLGAVVSLFVRFRRARGEERQQIKWFVFASALTLVFTFAWEELPNAKGEPTEVILAVSGMLIVPLIPVATGIAVFRYRLYDIDLVINRTLIYGALTACVVLLYVLVVGGLGAVLRVQGSLIVSLIATGLAAVLFQPLRDRLQRTVNRLMYGERHDPYAVLSRLGQRLESTLAPGAVLPTVVETVAQALKLPYVAVEVGKNNVPEIAASTGEPARDPLRMPLVYSGEIVGSLILAPRAGEESFAPADRRLLEDLAHQIGVAVHAARLTEEAVRLSADLQRSRERLVSTREEERRRLRRDLHDGLGPRLAAQSLKVGSARMLYDQDPQTADTLLSELESDIEATLSEIRRLVYDLRPPALDELGLVGAIRDAAERYTSHATNGLDVSVRAPDKLPPLSAAVEVASYRIVQEALANVAHHANATYCVVRLATEGGLQIEVSDDGVGIPEDHRSGVGLHSMRERAEELGGTCVVERSASGGTRVLARLPLPDHEKKASRR